MQSSMNKTIIRTFLIIFISFVGYNLYAVEEKNDATAEYIEEFYKKALADYDIQQYEKSLDNIRHVIKSDMDNYKLRYLAAHNHWKLGNFESAEAHFKRTISAEPNNAGPYIDYSLMQLHMRDYKRSEKTAKKGIKVLSGNKIEVPSKLYNIIARIKLLNGNAKESLEYAEKAKSLLDQKGTGVKDKLEAMVLEARSQLLLKNFDKAELSMQWALSLRKTSPYLHNLLGYVYSTWATSIIESDPKRADNLKQNALNHYQIALKQPNVADNFKEIIEENIKKIQ